jgi:hypothetical protein
MNWQVSPIFGLLALLENAADGTSPIGLAATVQLFLLCACARFLKDPLHAISARLAARYQ